MPKTYRYITKNPKLIQFSNKYKSLLVICLKTIKIKNKINFTVVFRMHLHNEELRKKGEKKGSSVHKHGTEGTSGVYVDKFGFHATTCCGYIPQDNSWTDDWPVSLYKI